MIANVIWLYYWPFHLFSAPHFPFVALLVVLLEAGILFATRVPWPRSIISSLLGNAASYLVGLALISTFRGSPLLPDNAAAFSAPSHLWRAFFIAYLFSVFIEALVYRAIIRSFRLPRLLLLAAITNFASYTLIIAVNWHSTHDVLHQMDDLPDLPLLPQEPPSATP